MVTAFPCLKRIRQPITTSKTTLLLSLKGPCKAIPSRGVAVVPGKELG